MTADAGLGNGASGLLIRSTTEPSGGLVGAVAGNGVTVGSVGIATRAGT
jgi:hypothetical protein